jgi:hypothetical protein
MSPVKVGDAVLYSAFGRVVLALVLAAREGEVSHLGQGGEPLLTLAFPKFPAPNAPPHKHKTEFQAAVALPEIQIEHDVVHCSHEFSAEFKKDKGLTTPAQIASLRGHGEWREYESDASEAIAELRADRAQAWTNCHNAELAAAQQRARAEKAEAELKTLSAPPTATDSPTA